MATAMRGGDSTVHLVQKKSSALDYSLDILEKSIES